MIEFLVTCLTMCNSWGSKSILYCIKDARLVELLELILLSLVDGEDGLSGCICNTDHRQFVVSCSVSDKLLTDGRCRSEYLQNKFSSNGDAVRC